MKFLRRLGALWRDHPMVLLSAALYRIPFHPIRLSPLLTQPPLPVRVKGRLLWPLLLPHPHSPLSFGETGHGLSFVVAGFICCAHKPSS